MLKYIQIGENSFIPSYNIFVGIGIALAMLYLQYEEKFSELGNNQKNTIHLGIFISIIFGFIGAFTFDAYTQGITINLNNINKIGLTFWGGTIAGLLTCIIFLKLNSTPILQTLNLLTPAFCISHVVGRIGCFFAGCCYGSPTNFLLGVKFPKDSLAYSHFQTDLHVHPTQIYESLFVLLVFLFLRRPSFKNKFLFYILSYSIFRFLIEFLRADNRGIIFNQTLLTPSQFISLIIAIFTISIVRTAQLQPTND